jgi:hypothetical protein
MSLHKSLTLGSIVPNSQLRIAFTDVSVNYLGKSTPKCRFVSIKWFGIGPLSRQGCM